MIHPDGTLGISSIERLAFVRPSVDWLFETVAASYGNRAIAVVLSGANADGARGAMCVGSVGGTVLIQSPDSCEYPQMPLAAIRSGVAHTVLRVSEMAAAIATHASRIDAEHRDAC